MDDSLDDILDGALDDFEELTSKPDEAASRSQERRPTTTSSPVAAAAAALSSKPAFDPLNKQQRPKRKSPPTKAAPSNAAGPNSAASVDTPAKLPPELEQLAADLAKLIAETNPDNNGSPGTATSSSQAGRGLGQAPMASTSASLHALDELRQQAVASQGALPAAGGQQGGGLFGGLLPDMENLKEPGMNVIVDSIMQHLLSKEVLQQPMQEIRDCYPPWLERNKGKIVAEDLERYTRQYAFIQQICQLYQDRPDDYSTLVSLMQQMQACGDPPEDIVREMSAGLEHLPPGEGEAAEEEATIDLQQLQQEINKCPVQ